MYCAGGGDRDGGVIDGATYGKWTDGDGVGTVVWGGGAGGVDVLRSHS